MRQTQQKSIENLEIIAMANIWFLLLSLFLLSLSFLKLAFVFGLVSCCSPRVPAVQPCTTIANGPHILFSL